jgi:hypothetical protein
MVGFVNGFTNLLCQVVVGGMDESNKSDLMPIVYQKDSPLFSLLCGCPILTTMAKRLYPTKFDWNAVRKQIVSPFKFVKNLKPRVRGDFSIYSLASYLKEKVENISRLL